MRKENLERHVCERAERWDMVDGRGIFLCFVCSLCEKAKLSRYRPEILRPYTQADVDEPIESDDWGGDSDW